MAIYTSFSLIKTGDFSKKLSSRTTPDFNKSGYNIILICLTNLRYGHLGIDGYKRDTSPNIDKLANYSLVFDNAFTHASWTLPASVSLFTSQYPFQHKIFDGRVNDKGEVASLNQNTITLIDILKNNGYLTAAFTGDRDHIPAYGLLGRFDHYEYYLSNKINDTLVKGDYPWAKYGVMKNVIPSAIKWINKNHNNKFFLFIQGYDLHSPFAMPGLNNMFDTTYKGSIDFSKMYWNYENEKPVLINGIEYYNLQTADANTSSKVLFNNRDIEHMSALYDGEIYNTDKWIGRLLNAINKKGLLENTIIIITSEHGDMLGEHGRFMRSGPLKDTFYDQVLHVPLIIYHPSLKHKRIKGLAQLIDISPTLLDFFGIQAPETFTGKNLADLIIHDKEVNDYVTAATEYTPRVNDNIFNKKVRICSIRNKLWKLIIEKEYGKNNIKTKKQLYHIPEDADENNNLFNTRNDIAVKYETMMNHIYNSLKINR